MPSVEDRREQLAVLLWIQLEIGVLHEEDVAGCRGQPVAHGRALAEIDRVLAQADARIAQPAVLLDDPPRVVVATRRWR